jgi:hypothetical protein
MEPSELTDEQCDKIAAQTMDRVAALKGLEHATHLNTDISVSHTLRRELIRAGAALKASGDAIDARRRCGHCLGNTRWCPECALNERLSNDDIHELAMHSTLLECIDDAYQERGDWLPHVRSFALDVLNAALGNPTSSPKSDVDMRASIKAPSEFCWLVELFEPGGNSMGLYHTGFTELDRTTSDPHKAKRYATKEAALASVDKLLSKAGVWRAIEHGFHGAGK